jgi:hypothetical protein
MASNDDSFNAEGPTVVAFETLTNNNQTFGVSVTGTQCGVYGESSTRPMGTRRSASAVRTGTGVHGLGDAFGVVGEGGGASILGFNTAGVTAVRGINQGNTRRSGGTGVEGISRDLRRTRTPPGDGEGVIGASNHDLGVGVVGLSVKNFSTNPLNPLSTRRTGDGSGTGVLGASGSGHGVHRTSEQKYGGVFESKIRAQLRLKPIDIFALFPDGNGDPNGKIGRRTW